MEDEKIVAERAGNVDKRGFVKSLLNELKGLFLNPQKLIPVLILAGVWTVMPLITGYYAKSNIPVVRFFCTLTYAKGGIFGGFFGMVGGILGKAVFAAVVNGLVLALWARKNPFAGFGRGLDGIFTGGIEAVAQFLCGGGGGMMAYVLFNITSAPQNSAIAVVCVLAAVRAVTMRNGLLFAGGFYLLKKLSNGRSPSFSAVSRFVTGLAAGFAVALPATFLRSPMLIAGVGLWLAVVGIVISIAARIGRHRAAVVVAVSLAFLSAAVSGSGVKGFESAPDGYWELIGTETSSTYVSNRRVSTDDAASIDFKFSRTNHKNKVYARENGSGRDNVFSWKVDEDLTTGLGHRDRMESVDQVGYTATCTKPPRILPANQDLFITLSAKRDYSRGEGFPKHQYHEFQATFSDADVAYRHGMKFEHVGGDKSFRFSHGKKIEVDDNSSDMLGMRGTLFSNSSPASFSMRYRIRVVPPIRGRKDLVLRFECRSGNPYLYTKKWRYRWVAPPMTGGSAANGSKKTGARVEKTSGQKAGPAMDRGDRERSRGRLSDVFNIPRGVTLALVTLLTALLGAGGGVVASVISGALGSGVTLEFEPDRSEEGRSEENDLGPHITRDAAGDLSVKDPATGESRTYKANGDGTYTNPISGATYTEQDLKASLESRGENADLITEDKAVSDSAISAQRAVNAELSQLGKEAVAEAERERAQAVAEAGQRKYVEKLKGKYSAATDDGLRRAVAGEQARAEIESLEQMELEGEYRKSQKYCENVEKAADIAIDVGAELGGEQGKRVKDAYTFAKSTLVRGSEAFAEGRSVVGGLAEGAVDGTIKVKQNHMDGVKGKMAANVIGDGAIEGAHAAIKGENLATVAVKTAEAGSMAALNTGMEAIADFAGETTKNIIGSEKTVGNILDTAVTNHSATDAIKTGITDKVKNDLGDAFTTSDD